MQVDIVEFPATRVALIEHRGPPWLEHETARRLIAWKLEQRLLDPKRHRSYGLHHTDPRSTPPAQHRVDFCVSIDQPVPANDCGIVERLIPAARCAHARHLGSRAHNLAAVFLHEQWLPASGETQATLPMIFHYVNVGPGVLEADMVTDVYLPLR